VADIEVRCRPTGGSAAAWTCTVRVGDDAAATSHEVTVSDGELARYAPGATDPAELIHASFEFLLEREPRTSILRRFELPAIERYFPEYPAVIASHRGRT
jgi:hypothetical protein